MNFNFHHQRIYYILFFFLVGTLFLVLVEYYTSKNITALVTGNENLIREFKVNDELIVLENDLLSIESIIKRNVVKQDTSPVKGIERHIFNIERSLDNLGKINDKDSSVYFLSKLENLVKQKLDYENNILDTFNQGYREDATQMILQGSGKHLKDSILALIQNITLIRKDQMESISYKLDLNGKNIQRFSILLFTVVILSTVVLFWYIVSIFKRQTHLINDLRTQQEIVKESAQLKENFLANMSHEIRTPLNAILGFSNLLSHEKLDIDSQQYIKNIQHSGENLLAIINDILDVSKIEAGMMVLESAPFDIRPLFDAAVMMFTPEAKQKNIIIQSEFDPTIPAKIIGDPTRLTQILINLLSNAIKFTPSGTIKIKVINQAVMDNRVQVGIVIEDTGIGIEKSKLDSIFTRFSQADKSVTRQYGGTGLGLSIVKDLVQLHHGTILAESTIGKGTVFKLTLPYIISHEASDVQPVQAIREPQPTDLHTNINILIIEDNEINQSLIRHLLNKWGYRYQVADNGKQAIELYDINIFDLVLMDIQMPEMDGYTTTHYIREKLKSNVKIIAMTAHAMPGEKEKCILNGMNDYISKPIQANQLLEMIRRHDKKDQTMDSKIDPGRNHKYEYINLAYLKEISMGDLQYEMTVTMQFIEALPTELLALKKAYDAGDFEGLKKMAHHMKSTVSVMGITELVNPSLDKMEYFDRNKTIFENIYYQLHRYCIASIKEAKDYLQEISDKVKSDM